MKINAKTLVAFVKVLGFQLDEANLKPLDSVHDEPVVEPAVTPVVVNAVSPPVEPAAVPEPPAPAAPSNLPMLDQLINDMGGFEAFKAVLLKVVEAGNAPQPAPQPTQNQARAVDYGALGLSANASKKQTPAPRPQFLFREPAKV